MKKIILIATITILIISNIEGGNFDYCKIRNCFRTHTMCQYNTSQPAVSCGFTKTRRLTDEDRNLILQVHNILRDRVAKGREKRGNPGPQPAARDLKDLVWDNELELIAQRWANQCTHSHDKCRDVSRFLVGQNIAISWHHQFYEEKEKLTNLIYIWYDEVEDFDSRQVHSFQPSREDPQIGHYTQMIWAKTTKLGCGAVRFKNGFYGATYLVCNYGPAGNWVGKAIYQAAKMIY